MHTITETKPRHGRNIKRFREWFDIKQETLAGELNWSQQYENAGIFYTDSVQFHYMFAKSKY